MHSPLIVENDRQRTQDLSKPVTGADRMVPVLNQQLPWLGNCAFWLLEAVSYSNTLLEPPFSAQLCPILSLSHNFSLINKPLHRTADKEANKQADK